MVQNNGKELISSNYIGPRKYDSSEKSPFSTLNFNVLLCDHLKVWRLNLNFSAAAQTP